MVGDYETALEVGAIYELTNSGWRFRARGAGIGTFTVWLLEPLDESAPALWLTPTNILAIAHMRGFPLDSPTLTIHLLHTHTPSGECAMRLCDLKLVDGEIALPKSLQNAQQGDNDVDIDVWGEALR